MMLPLETEVTEEDVGAPEKGGPVSDRAGVVRGGLLTISRGFFHLRS